MAGKNQCSDYAQTGPGVTTGASGSIKVPDKQSAPSIAPAGTNPSGSSQSDKRGPQG